ncbi:MAG TPA: hypothetical protein PKH81_08420, partial [Treponemataceae bacterium]|nr:hypothetical protein [Treponemataceae bacterium]
MARTSQQAGGKGRPSQQTKLSQKGLPPQTCISHEISVIGEFHGYRFNNGNFAVLKAKIISVNSNGDGTGGTRPSGLHTIFTIVSPHLDPFVEVLDEGIDEEFY